MSDDFDEFAGPEDEGCPECKRFGGNHDPVCSEYDPPQRCEECGGRTTYGSINACLGCGGRGWA